MNTRSEQLSRASLAAGFAVATAAVSHTIAGGEAPSVIAVALSFLLATLVSIPLVGKSASLLRISATVFLGQMVLHGLYSMFPATSLASQVTAQASAPGMHNHSLGILALPDALSAAEAAPALWMTLAHVMAGILAIVVLRQADFALAVVRAARRFVLAIFELPGAVEVLPTPRTVAADALRIELPSSVFLSVVQRRGPPRTV